jgi:hypothetical protein
MTKHEWQMTKERQSPSEEIHARTRARNRNRNRR